MQQQQNVTQIMSLFSSKPSTCFTNHSEQKWRLFPWTIGSIWSECYSVLCPHLSSLISFLLVLSSHSGLLADLGICQSHSFFRTFSLMVSFAGQISPHISTDCLPYFLCFCLNANSLALCNITLPPHSSVSLPYFFLLSFFYHIWWFFAYCLFPPLFSLKCEGFFRVMP